MDNEAKVRDTIDKLREPGDIPLTELINLLEAELDTLRMLRDDGEEF